MTRGKAPALTADACREILLAKRAELISASRHVDSGLAELARVAEDDQAPELHEAFISLEVSRLDYQTLKQVNAALDRLATGDFGVCTACGGDISPKRLAAIPWAQWCIACQKRDAAQRTRVNANWQPA